MKFENNFDTEVQKADLFTFLPTIILPEEKGRSNHKSKPKEINRSSIKNKKEVVHKLIKFFKNA